MTEVAGLPPISNTFFQQAQNNPVEFLKNLDDLLEQFGPEELGNAVTQQFIGTFIDKLKELINDSDQIPESVKDMANTLLDSHKERVADDCPCSEEASEAVDCCAQSGDIDQSAESAAEEAAETANELQSPEAAAEAAEESANESEGASGADDGTDAAVQNNQNLEESDDPEDKKEPANWFEAVAMALAEVQSKFLDKALAASEEMTNEANNATGEGNDKSAKFLEAQSLFTANMQLFNLFANQSATALKTLGEALAGIARKQ